MRRDAEAIGRAFTSAAEATAPPASDAWPIVDLRWRRRAASSWRTAARGSCRWSSRSRASSSPSRTTTSPRSGAEAAEGDPSLQGLLPGAYGSLGSCGDRSSRNHAPSVAVRRTSEMTRTESRSLAAATWAVGGVAALLMESVVRLGTTALAGARGGFSFAEWLALALTTALLAYVEGYRGFHRSFSPRVVERAFDVAHDPWAAQDRPRTALRDGAHRRIAQGPACEAAARRRESWRW